MSDQQTDGTSWTRKGSRIRHIGGPEGYSQTRARGMVIDVSPGTGIGTWTGATALAARIHRLLVEDDARIALTHVDDAPVARGEGTAP